jgi:hypothetical protein
MSMPYSSEPADQLYRRLLALHEEAFNAERFDVGYHVLAAALHAAEEIENLELLEEVGQLAQDRQKKIDGVKPQHRMSTTAALKRGNPAQYTSLVNIAAAARGRLKADQALLRNQRARGVPPRND